MPKIPAYNDEPEPAEDAAENENSTVATLPKSILRGKSFEVGDELVLKISAIREGEIDVEPGSDTGEEPEPEEAPAEEMAEEEGGEESGEEIAPPAASAGPPAYE